MNDVIFNDIKDSIETKQRLLNDESFLSRIQVAAEICVESLKNEGKIHFCGNGGSAADAQHLAAELSCRFYYDRPPLNAEALHVNSSYMTAVSNDYSYEDVFSRMLECSARRGDVLVGISTSGNSANVMKAIEVAKRKGVKVIGFTGETGGKMAQECDVLLNVPSKCTPRIQEVHIMIGHILCELIEAQMFPKK